MGALRSERLPAGFWTGVAGLAWVVHRSGTVAPQALSSIDDALRAAVGGWRGSHDLVSGLVGIGVYAVVRGNRGLLAGVVDALEQSSRLDDHGRFWWTAPELLPDHQRGESPKGHVDLGVAHGLAGVCWLLAAAAATVPAAARLLPETVAWLLARPRASRWGHYPSWTRLDGADAPAARIAWCYGDLGIAAVLAQCGQVAAQPAWTERATELAVGAARRPDVLSGVIDSSVCHGAAGVALLFGHLARTTGVPEITAAEVRWRCRIGAQAGAGLLEGAGGSELVRAGTDPTWDVALLARLP